MSPNDPSSSGDAELDALVRDLSRKVRTTDGQWARDQTPLDGPSLGAGASTDAAASVEAQAEALIAALDDADAGIDAGARVVDVADIDRFASAEMKQEADDIIALMMKYENVGASGSGGAAARETSSDEVAAALADATLELVGAERADEGDGELKALMKKLAGDLKAEKAEEKSSRKT